MDLLLNIVPNVTADTIAFNFATEVRIYLVKKEVKKLFRLTTESCAIVLRKKCAER